MARQLVVLDVLLNVELHYCDRVVVATDGGGGGGGDYRSRSLAST